MITFSTSFVASTDRIRDDGMMLIQWFKPKPSAPSKVFVAFKQLIPIEVQRIPPDLRSINIEFDRCQWPGMLLMKIYYTCQIILKHSLSEFENCLGRASVIQGEGFTLNCVKANFLSNFHFSLHSFNHQIIRLLCSTLLYKSVKQDGSPLQAQA